MKEHEYNIIIWGNDCAKWDTVIKSGSIISALAEARERFNQISIEQIARVEVLDITLYNEAEGTRKNVEDNLTASKISKGILA